MCDNLGPLQLFLTFTCDGKAPAFQNATGLRDTWKDPVLFAIHFQRKWNKLFEIIKKQWATKIGGITDWCYVMEIQDRGSPHNHMLLWTNKSADELLLDETIVCARMPPINSPLHNHQKSREVVWVPMNLPHDQSRGIRPDFLDLSIPGSSKQVFAKTLVDHYEARTGNTTVQSLLLIDFVKYYYPCSTTKEKQQYQRLAEENQMEYQQEYGQHPPSAIISGEITFRLRKIKCRFWRTRLVSAMSDSETFYYQQILTHMPVYGRSFTDFKDDSLRASPNDDRVFSWHDLYQHLVQNDLLRVTTIIPDDIVEYNIHVATIPLAPAQQTIFNSIIHQIQHLNSNMHWILGGAGTGKSFLLRKFSKHFSDLGY
ncbi:Glutamate--tRNA ligase mitochondrial [Mucor velutinosus]|uniref:Glutamate--tRNA ligase mitochondrial n=1 Tax=Mucor velutinosus TaxID=708070 RepID=A0AAN7DPY9_9FUNG|nr:Glutamate--tRNA ligase mitochondrial [Mucor velutinosus]